MTRNFLPFITIAILAVGTVSCHRATSPKEDEEKPCGRDEDWDCDGIPDNCYTYERDDHNNISRETLDVNCDGSLFMSFCYEYEYDKHGNILKQSYGNCDEPVPEKCATYTYDSDGSVVTTQLYLGDCNESTPTCSTVLETDDNDNILQASSDPDCDGDISDGNVTCYRYTYDENSNLIMQENTTNCTEELFFVQWLYEYDDNNRLIIKQAGNSDDCTLQKWDCSNNN